jgi:hypothetical protein
MKTHDFANQLELLARFLRSLPNAELEESVQRSLLPPLALRGEADMATQENANKWPADINEQLRNMPPAEIEKYLKSNTPPFTSTQLLALAERLGISASKRQSKEALVNVIARFFEANQMDKMIRGTRKDES